VLPEKVEVREPRNVDGTKATSTDVDQKAVEQWTATGLTSPQSHVKFLEIDFQMCTYFWTTSLRMYGMNAVRSYLCES
jgi:hypothetical protein